MKKHRKWTWIALAVCAAVLGWSYVELHAIGGNLQYLVPAPAMDAGSGSQSTPPDNTQPGAAQPGGEQTEPVRPNAQSLTLWESLQTTANDWNGIIQHYTLTGVAETISLESDAESTGQARLVALGPDAFALSAAYLRVGRLFYPEELASGSHGILLDEQLALALFRIAEPIGRTVTLADTEFTVIGVLRHAKRVGNGREYSAYVTLAALWDLPVALDALQVTAAPQPGAGASAVFSADMKLWQAGGTMINLRKESMGALLPLRMLLFLCGATLFFALLRLWNNRTRSLIAGFRRRLDTEYAARLLPRFTPRVLALCLGYAVLALAAGVLIRYLVAPVYTFPEWVPAVLVDWKSIQETFWAFWQNEAGLRELRSPELIRIRYFGMLSGWFSAGGAVLLASLWAGRRQRPSSPDQP